MLLNTPKFSLGQVVATPGCLAALSEAGQSAYVFLRRHNGGDWGDLDDEDKEANELALRDGSRLFSAYHLNDGTKIWIITEADLDELAADEFAREHDGLDADHHLDEPWDDLLAQQELEDFEQADEYFGSYGDDFGDEF